jgi:hypothetical protein
MSVGIAHAPKALRVCPLQSPLTARARSSARRWLVEIRRACRPRAPNCGVRRSLVCDDIQTLSDERPVLISGRSTMVSGTRASLATLPDGRDVAYINVRRRDRRPRSMSASTAALPHAVRADLADALARLDEGHMLSMPLSRPMPSIGPGVHELRIKDRSRAYRTIYALGGSSCLRLSTRWTRRLPIRWMSSRRPPTRNRGRRRGRRRARTQ